MTDTEREAEIRHALSQVTDHPNTAAIFLLTRLDYERGQHDRRVTALLQANTLEVERRREAEAEIVRLKQPMPGDGACDRVLAWREALTAEGLDAEEIALLAIGFVAAAFAPLPRDQVVGAATALIDELRNCAGLDIDQHGRIIARGTDA